MSTAGEFLGNTAYFIAFDNKQALEPLYMLKILNSKLLRWYYQQISVQLGSQAVRMFTIYVIRIPIPFYDSSIDECTKIVNEQNNNILENLIYRLYHLSDAEIDYITKIIN